MTLETLITSNTYEGDGVTTHFPYTYTILEATDVQVWITDQFGTVTQITSGFTMDTANSQVIYPSSGSPLPADGSTIELRRVLPLTQEVAFTNGGPFSPTIIGKALDRLTMMMQQLQYEIDHISISGSTTPTLVAQPSYSVDLPITTPGNGIILITPSGSAFYRISLTYDSGLANVVITTEFVTSAGSELVNPNPGYGIVVVTPDGTKNYRIAISNSGVITSALVGVLTPYDITFTVAQKGPVITTPDGLHTGRIEIDNAGEINTEKIT